MNESLRRSPELVGVRLWSVNDLHTCLTHKVDSEVEAHHVVVVGSVAANVDDELG